MAGVAANEFGQAFALCELRLRPAGHLRDHIVLALALRHVDASAREILPHVLRKIRKLQAGANCI